jgi:aspartokinase-like uncharacterized kinase
MAMLTVVKVGGGLGRADALERFCEALGVLGERHRLVVVPGGAWFADAVREADRRFGLADATAHRMAILGMEQFGLLLRERLPETTPVVMPASLPLGELPESWRVTSDSIAAWVAGQVGADRLVLVKEVDGLFAAWPPDGEPLRELSVAELASRRLEGVDEYLPTLLEHAAFETWVIGGRDPGRLTELLERGTTLGTRIGLLPWRHG